MDVMELGSFLPLKGSHAKLILAKKKDLQDREDPPGTSSQDEL
jgi:hypothetical protein